MKTNTLISYQPLSSIVTIASELGNFNYAEQTIKRYADIVKNKGYHYIILCELYCKYYWNKLDYEKSIEWGDKGLLGRGFVRY